MGRRRAARLGTGLGQISARKRLQEARAVRRNARSSEVPGEMTPSGYPTGPLTTPPCGTLPLLRQSLSPFSDIRIREEFTARAVIQMCEGFPKSHNELRVHARPEAEGRLPVCGFAAFYCLPAPIYRGGNNSPETGSYGLAGEPKFSFRSVIGPSLQFPPSPG